MRLALDARAQRLLRRVSHKTVYSALELVLLSLLAVQTARFIWLLLTPVGPIGEWTAGNRLTAPPAASPALFSSFDPFFRLASASGPATVTTLNVQLFGVRVDQASGRGSAILSTPEGGQASFAVGEEIMPGVTLKSVQVDGVTLSRGGVDEQLFLDQPLPGANPVAGAASAGAATARSPTVATNTFMREVQLIPRLEGGRVNGFLLRPAGSGIVFRSAGLQANDVLLTINGRRVTGADDAQSTIADLPADGVVRLEVERGGRVVPLQMRAGGQ